MKSRRELSAAIAAALLGLHLAAPVLAQESAPSASALEEVVVTARRREELLQDVPISMTVFNQRQLDNANVINSSDLARYTPSLSANQRFGSENSSFAIRGFTQELRTTASVGTYFAEVVAPRGANAQTSGDGAGPGSFFDLENVQVLKGPQGTLFGRNTTGGAVLLTPKRPTEEFEGYLEGGAGNHDMYRSQAVVNVPASERVKLRFGFDQQRREGYLDNITSIGPNDLADVNYVAGRASMTVNITDTVENYTVATYTDSNTNGQPSTLVACNDGPPAALLGAFYIPYCNAQLARQEAAGQNDFYDVASSMPEAGVKIEQWQAINHTDWEINDELLLKNIIAYANLETTNATDLFGLDFLQPSGGQRVFATAGIRPGLPTTSQSSFVEELQLQGTSFDEALTWQGGLYYEKSEPDGDSGQQSPGQIDCDLATINTDNPDNFRCSGFLGNLSNVLFTENEVEYDNRAVYAQATYDIDDRWSTTGGARYTWDDTKGKVHEIAYLFDSDGILEAPNVIDDHGVVQMEQESDEPTWVADVTYTPTANNMVYAKYARGYRQGSVNPAGEHQSAPNGERIDIHGPEKVDTYEIGSKNSFEGRLPGIFNIAAFYNDFRDQQLQQGILTSNGTGSTAIVNAGKSRIWGVEVESNVNVTDNLQLGLAYTYLNTEVLELEDVSALVASTGATPAALSTSEGEELPYSPKNQVVINARYTVPVPASYGDVELGATYVYFSDQLAVSETVSPMYELDSYDLVNFNLNWNRIAGSAFDGSLFVTNALDEEYEVYRSGLWGVAGFETGMTGIPRMFGARLRYNFGAAN